MNPRLHPMKTQLHDLGAGETFAPANASLRQVVLARGEVLVQPPARLLGGQVVFLPAQRLQAPAEWPWEEGSVVIAAGDAQLVLQQRPGVIDALRSFFGAARPRPALKPA